MAQVKKYPIIFGILLDVFVFKFTSDLVTLIITGFWIITIRNSKLDAKVSLFGGLISLVICSLFLMFKLNLPADKIATWAYIFLSVGTLQTLWEHRKEND